MKRQSVLPLLLFLFLSGSVEGQFVWHQGNVTLSTGIKLWGELSYQAQKGTLLVRTNGKLRSYTAEHLRRFRYTDGSTWLTHDFAVYPVPQLNGEAIPIIFKELVPSATVPLLQLPIQYKAKWAAKHGLPKYQTKDWETPQPWYVWFNNQPLLPEVFVANELNNLIAGVPKEVQDKLSRVRKPTSPVSLARWLVYFNGYMNPREPFVKSSDPTWVLSN